eukprot:scaffold3450_cov114-Cylindrotheca_fusiformis.AAC.28
MLPNLLLSFLLLLSSVSAQRFLREGFSNQMESDFRGEMKLEDNESASGMTRDMFLMKEINWELQNVDFRNVENVRLRHHLETIFNQPVTLKLSTRKGKYGLRAIGQLQSGKRLRAFWRQSAGTTQLKVNDFLSAKYDDAVQSRLSMIEFEVQLPPSSKKSKVLPSVVFSIPVEPGTMNAKAVVPRGGICVSVLPEGHGSGVAEPVLKAGKAHVSLPMRAGLVDVGWAKGRSVFRKGRINGIV